MSEFFLDNFPAPLAIACWGPPSLAFAYASLRLAGFLKQERGVPTGYTRKIFHFLIVGSAALVQLLLGIEKLFIFGAATSLVIFHAVYRGPGHVLYEGIARETDAPRATRYILIPYLATLIGGIVSNLCFGDAALVGYLVTGFADGAAEPVGTRWGSHVYRVPSPGGGRATRSAEGSAAVFVVSVVAIVAGVEAAPLAELGTRWPVTVPAVAACCALVEALSPHGWDNATLQVIPSFLAWSLF